MDMKQTPTQEQVQKRHSPPTVEDIVELALHNPLLFRVIKAGKDRKLSWEETMMWAVKVLVEKNEELTQQRVYEATRVGRPE